MPYKIFLKHWFAGLQGEHNESDWLYEKTCDTLEAANSEGRRLRRWSPTGGTWVKIEEEETETT